MTWQDAKDSGLTWGDLKDSGLIWGDLKDNSIDELKAIAQANINCLEKIIKYKDLEIPKSYLDEFLETAKSANINIENLIVNTLPNKQEVSIAKKISSTIIHINAFRQAVSDFKEVAFLANAITVLRNLIMELLSAS